MTMSEIRIDAETKAAPAKAPLDAHLKALEN